VTDLGGWNLPFEENTITTELPGIGDIPVAQGVVVMGAMVPTPLGVLPCLVFRFDVPGAPMPSIVLLGTPDVIRGTAQLVDQAAAAAIRKAAQHQ
jgi:hypothetical protein